jgi:hypothetical protein
MVHSCLVGLSGGTLAVPQKPGYTVEEVRRLSVEAYSEMQDYIRNSLNANGSTGRLKFDENQKPAHLGVFQVSGDHAVLVGTVDPDNMTSANRNDVSVNLLDNTNVYMVMEGCFHQQVRPLGSNNY